MWEKFDFGWVSAPDPDRELTALPRRRSWIQGVLLLREREGRGQEEGEGKWREGSKRGMGRGKGGEGKGPSPPNAKTTCRLCIDVWLGAATPHMLWEKLERFKLSEILGCRCLSETFMTYLYKKRTLYYCRNVLCVRSTIAPSSVKQCLPVLVELVLSQ